MTDEPDHQYDLRHAYLTGTGQVLAGVHPENEGCGYYGCVVHAPSRHHMRDWPTNWRWEGRIMERLCPHGVGHPDPDDAYYRRRRYGELHASLASAHGCDGCCRPPETNACVFNIE